MFTILFLIIPVACFCEPEIRKVFMIFDQEVKLAIDIDCLPVAFRALGRIPTEKQMQTILNGCGGEPGMCDVSS